MSKFTGITTDELLAEIVRRRNDPCGAPSHREMRRVPVLQAVRKG